MRHAPAYSPRLALPPRPSAASGFSDGKSAVFEARSAAGATVSELLNQLALERSLPRAGLALFAGAATVAGSHPPLDETQSLRDALVAERHAASAGEAHVHELTLAIDESTQPETGAGKLRDAAAAATRRAAVVAGSPGEDLDDNAFVNSSKGEPTRHSEDARHRR